MLARMFFLMMFNAMSFNRDTVSSAQLGPLGLVAATIEELGVLQRFLNGGNCC